MEFEIGEAGEDLLDAGAVYSEVGFRPDLIDDLVLVRGVGGGVFRARRGARTVGVSSCLPFGPTGWIGGVAVLPEHRGEGLGRRLTARAVQALTERGVTTQLLHATPMAVSLYERLGFDRESESVELTGPAPAQGPDPLGAAITRGTDDHLDDVLALDRRATGEDRSALLRALWPEGSSVATTATGEVRGYHLRQTPSAVGAVVAADPATGHALLSRALAARAGARLRVPLPAGHEDLRAELERSGFRETTRTTLMRLGPPRRRTVGDVVTGFNLYWG